MYQAGPASFAQYFPFEFCLLRFNAKR
jgi:hypothetical protein